MLALQILESLSQHRRQTLIACRSPTKVMHLIAGAPALCSKCSLLQGQVRLQIC